MSHPRARRDQTRTLSVAVDAAREALSSLERPLASIRRSGVRKGSPPVDAPPKPRALSAPPLRRRPLPGSSR